MIYSKKFLNRMRISLPKEDIGYVYIFKLRNMIKIGKSVNHPKKRMKQLSISESAELHYFNKYINYHYIEKEFHVLLKNKRITNSEWFEDVTEEEIEFLKNWKKERIVYE